MVINIIGEILGTVAGLYVLNNIPSWNLQFITQDYLIYLPYANMCILGTCVVRILLHCSPGFRLRYFFEALAQVINIFSLYKLLTIFPFSFSPVDQIPINDVLRIGLTFILAILSLSFLITIFRLVKGKSS